MKRRDTLERLKRRLSDRYLGVGGIHGLGLVHDGRTLRVYCNPGDSAEQQSVLAKLKCDAEPLNLEVIAKLPPRPG